MRKRLMFYCQPVLGIGHYIRSRAIVRALAADFDVSFVNGGEIVKGLEMPAEINVINLPALKSDAEFQQIFSHGEMNLAAIKTERKQLLLDIFDHIKPDLLILELFPFGRRQFDFELLPLLEHTENSPAKIVCSLRDILVSKRNQTQFEDDAVRLMNQYFDLLLVHSDPNFQRLEETFPRVNELTCVVQYTGFVAQQAAQGERAETALVPKILISIGGGRVGEELLLRAIESSKLLAQTLPHQLHILTGPHFPDEQFQALQMRVAVAPQISLERFTPDFSVYLARADLSISLAGYNTCMDILQTNVRAILYPFTGNNNQEQTIRARKLEKLGRVRMIAPENLTPENLATMIEQYLQAPAPVATNLRLDGAATSARILREMMYG